MTRWILTPEELLAHGGLHDSRITSVSLRLDQGLVVIVLHDLNANFEGMIDDEGLRPAELHLRDVKVVTVGADTVDVTGMKISDAQLEPKGVGFVLKIGVSTNDPYFVHEGVVPGGLYCECGSVEVHAEDAGPRV